MTSPSSVALCRVGVLEHKKYTEHFEPLIREVRAKRSAEVVAQLRAFLMSIGDSDLREDALGQLERIEVAVSGNRWQSNAAGFVLEASCVDNAETVPDLSGLLDTCSTFLYDWDESHAETIFTFFGFLSDHTVRWASPPDTWRAVVPPSNLQDIGEAMNALTPRDMRKMLEGAEDGDVFSEDEAREFSAWWEAMRKGIRMANRLEEGLYVCVEQPES